MKKRIIAVLALLALCTGACCAGVDYSSMTDAELSQLIAGAQAELDTRNGSEYLYDENGIKVSFTGWKYFTAEEMGRDEPWLYIYVTMENGTDNQIKFIYTDTYVNDISSDGGDSLSILAGKSKICVLKMNQLERSGIRAADDIDSATFAGSLYGVVDGKGVDLQFDIRNIQSHAPYEYANTLDYN